MKTLNATTNETAANGTAADVTNLTSEESALKLPNWINSDYFKEILAADGKSKWRYISHDVRMANEKGENYASVLYRVKVIAENEGKLGENFRGRQFSVPTEMPHYQANCGIVTDKGLDWDHVKLVIERLSKFHAASAVVHENNGPYRDILLQGMYTEKMKPLMEVYFNTLVILKEIIQKLTNGDKYLRQMENYEEKCFTKTLGVTKCNPDDFNVLNHGDLWTNNIMFKYDDNNKVEDMLFIDLQMSVWGSPAIDLHYFIVSSTEKKLKTSEFDAIIQYYHEHLVKTLKELGYRGHIPTLLEIQVDLLKRGFLGVMASMSVLPVVLLTECEDADINLFISNFFKDFTKKYLRSSNMIQSI